MKYIYDIVLNFQTNYYHFIEWKKNDNIKNYVCLPLYKVSDNDLLNLKNNKITISKDIIKKIIEDKNNKNKIICIVSNGLESIGLYFNEKGELLKKSSLIFEEEEEANNLVRNLKPLKIEYKNIIKQENKNKLRIEIEKKDKLIKYINKIDDELTLKYLYFDYFEKESPNIETIKNKLIKEINKKWTIKQNNLYKTIILLNKNTPTLK